MPISHENVEKVWTLFAETWPNSQPCLLCSNSKWVTQSWAEWGAWISAQQLYLQHDNAAAHNNVCQTVYGTGITVEPAHIPYSHDLAPSDFMLIPKLKSTLKQ